MPSHLGLSGAGNANYQAKIKGLFGSAIVGYWRQNESSGTTSTDISGNSFNGAYTGVTLGAQGIGDGNTAASFDGTTSFNNIYSAGLAGAFNGAEGSAIAWVKIGAAGVWTDATQRTFLQVRVDGNNLIQLRKSTTDNQIAFLYNAGAGSNNKTVTSTAFGGILIYICVAMTWSASGDSFKAYVNGSQVGATQTSLGTWTGALASNLTAIGAGSTTPANVMSGSIGPVLLLNRAATAAEILQAATV